MRGEAISEYEKQRLARISDNKARLEALGLPQLASSVLGSFSKRQPESRNLKQSKGKRSARGGGGEDEDEEYRPSESDDDRVAKDDSDEYGSSATEEEEEEVMTCVGSRRKSKNMSSSIPAKIGKRAISNKGQHESDIFDDKAALRQAIALSLETTKSELDGKSPGLSQNSSSSIAVEDAQRKKYKGKAQGSAVGRQKTIKLNKARIQLSEDEVVAYFFSFDETGKGYITTRDLKKMASSHDFNWTDIEIAQMIHCFDNGVGGKLSLEAFRSIVIRCRMLRGTEES